MISVGSGSSGYLPETLIPDGEIEEKPLVLYGDKAIDWEHFLAILHHELVFILVVPMHITSHIDISSNDDCHAPAYEECDSRLRIATKYEFLSIRNRTLLQLLARWPTGTAYNYADYLTLGREHRSGELMMHGYLKAWRAYPLAVTDGKRIASEDLVWLMQLSVEYSNTQVSKNLTLATDWVLGRMKEHIMPNAEWTLPPEFEWMWKKISS